MYDDKQIIHSYIIEVCFLLFSINFTFLKLNQIFKFINIRNVKISHKLVKIIKIILNTDDNKFS